MKYNFLSAGESHGKKLTAIIENIPANFDIDIDFINSELCRRQQGYGRGGRMKIENDRVEITSGVRFGKTTGAPIALEISNKDFEKWDKSMSITALSENDLLNTDLKTIKTIRPGHADLAGAIKYNQNDIRNILEHSSARETAIKVAVGAIAKQFLSNFSISVESKVISIGSVFANDFNGDKSNDLNCPDSDAYLKMKEEIDRAANDGVSLGGQIRLEINNLPIGLGSYANWDKKLDGLLAQALMSIQAVKSVEIGLGKQCSALAGDKVHDEIFYENGKIIRKTNNAGGIEGGMSNGEQVVITIGMKPIPTMKAALNSINIDDKTSQQAHFERCDTCAVPSCGVVAESMCAIIILQQFFEKFAGDSFEEILANYNNYLSMVNKR